MKEVKIEIADKEYKVLIAETEEERAQGLGNVESMDDDEGMLFIMPEDQGQVVFNTEEMEFDIDLVFIDQDDEVYNVVLGKAHSSEPIISTPESEDNCARMAVQELKDFLENGNIKNSVNFPAVNQPRESKVRLCITNKNMPNILARISKLFADRNLNIENMVNRSRGDYAYTLIDTNDDVRQDIIERIEAAEGIINVRVIK